MDRPLPAHDDQHERSVWHRTSTTSRVVATLTAAICAAAVTLDPDLPIASGVAVVAMIPAALVDVVDRRLPNRIVGVAAIVLLVALTMSASPDGFDEVAVVLGSSARGAALMAGPLLVLHILSPSAMGFGDVKGALVIGAGLGIAHVELALVALLIASGTTAMAGLVTRQRTLPFGPGLVIGAAATLAANGVIIGAIA